MWQVPMRAVICLCPAGLALLAQINLLVLAKTVGETKEKNGGCRTSRHARVVDVAVSCVTPIRAWCHARPYSCAVASHLSVPVHTWCRAHPRSCTVASPCLRPFVHGVMPPVAGTQ